MGLRPGLASEADRRERLDSWLHTYNHHRCHTALGGQPPVTRVRQPAWALQLVRYRAKLVALRPGLKAQVHAVMAKEGIIPRLDDVFGPTGQVFLDQVPLERAYAIRVESLRDLIEIYDREVDMLEREMAAGRRRLSRHPGDPRCRAACATTVEVRRQP